MPKLIKEERRSDSPLSEEMFDDRDGYEQEGGIHLPRDLSDNERDLALTFLRIFQGLWGVCIVLGDPGAGKDLFGNWVTWKMKRLFPWKRMIRDERPRKLFGHFDGLFNENVLKDDLMRMKQVAKERKRADITVGDAIGQEADVWANSKGEVLLKNSVLYLSEYWRYCYRREPNAPINRTMGAIHKVKRHLDCLIIGTAQKANELDRFTTLPWIDWQVYCLRSKYNKSGFTFFIQRVKYDVRQDKLLAMSRFFPLSIDAGKPRAELGDGKIRLLKPRYLHQNEEERVVLEVLKAGCDTYEGIVECILHYGDMSEGEILRTLKELKFRQSKRVVEFDCYFSLYNSKSAPQIPTTIRGDDG